MAPRVSVIIPAHNARQTLPETLDSVIGQTFEDWEAIVADDGSDDGTGELASGYHERVQCVRSERKLGIGGARNLALGRAGGELVALLDADDVWVPEYLERQVGRYDAARRAGCEVGIVCCDAYEFGPDGRRAHSYSRRAGWSDPVTLTSLLRGNTIFVSAMVPRAVLEELGGFATDCLGTEDYDMWLRIVESRRAVLAAREALVGYRVSDSALSANVAAMARATQTTYRHALARGRLDRRQRAIARRQIRLQALVEAWEELARARTRTGAMPWAGALRSTPLAARVLLERPTRWLHWLRIGTGILAGAPAAGVDRSRIT